MVWTPELLKGLLFLMPTHLIKSTTNHFVSSAGYVFKIINGKEFKLTPFFNNDKSELYVSINKKNVNLLYLMIEYFDLKYTPNDSLKFKITKELEIPLGSIIINPIAIDVSDEDENIIKAYRCADKASSANARCQEKISPLQVLSVLNSNKFTCIYCATELKPKDWHLDHYYPVSKGGKNVIGNLVSSCSTCNRMKGAQTGEQFYSQCKSIVKNFLFKPQ